MMFQVSKSSIDASRAPCKGAFKNHDGKWVVEIFDMNELSRFLVDNTPVYFYMDDDGNLTAELDYIS